MAKKGRALTRREIVNGASGGAIGLAFAIYSDRDSALFPIDSAGVPFRSLDLVAFTLFLGLFFGYAGWAKLRRTSAADKPQPTARRKLRRPPANAGSHLLVWQALLVAVSLWGFRNGGWDANSVGITPMHPLQAFAIGFFAYYLIVLVIGVVLARTGFLPRIRAHDLTIMANLWPRSRGQKICAFVALCCLNPFTEELLFRGILVHQFDQVFGSPYLPLVLGFIVTIGNHLYQGPAAMLTHIPFYFVVVALLYSPVGLVGCFGFHFAGDWFPVIGMKKALEHYQADVKARIVSWE